MYRNSTDPLQVLLPLSRSFLLPYEIKLLPPPDLWGGFLRDSKQ